MAHWDNSTRRARLPKDWPRIRRRIIRRDDAQCQWPTPEGICGAPGDEVDHRVRGDNHHPDNLWLLCAPHHQAKTIAERPTRRRPQERHPGLL